MLLSFHERVTALLFATAATITGADRELAVGVGVAVGFGVGVGLGNTTTGDGDGVKIGAGVGLEDVTVPPWGEFGNTWCVQSSIKFSKYVVVPGEVPSSPFPKRKLAKLFPLF